MASLDHLCAPIMPGSYPYKPARLVIPKPGSKDARWTISFWVYDIQKAKTIRILDRSINQIQDLQERKRHAQAKVKQINALLRSGHHINRDLMGKSSLNSIRLLDGLDHALATKEKLINTSRNNKIRSSSHAFYKKQLSTFKRWCKITQNSRLFLHQFSPDHAQHFMDFVDAQGYAGKTFNHHKATLHNLFNVLLDKNWIQQNPFAKIKSKKNDIHKNLPFSPAQLQMILQHIRSNFPAFLLPCMWLYYTFMRPNEMAHLKIAHIGQVHPGQIYLPGHLSKNKQARHIPIHPDLQAELDAVQIQAQPPDHFLFSKGFQPGATFLDPGNFSNRFNARVKKPLGLPDHLTFYNFKHTGVQMAYYSGISKAEIQVIMGHMNNSSFESYMQGLGIHDFQAFTRLMPSLGSSI